MRDRRGIRTRRGRRSMKGRHVLGGILVLVLFLVGACLCRKGDELPPVRDAVKFTAPRFANPECERTYARAFVRPTFEIRVVFGYKDARPARFVADRYERMLLVSRLLEKCGEGEGVCGFSRDARDGDLFTKEIAGPDGAPRAIRLRVVAASVGADDEENRKDPMQARRSAYAERVFLDGLRDAEVVIYNGHSRAGGGPDFRPPRIRRDLEVDYGWYRAHTPGLDAILDRLGPRPKGEGERLRLLGFLSCASTKLFLGQIGKARPELATLSSPNLLYFSDAFEASLEILDSILTMRCESRAGAARLIGWFEKAAR